MKLTNVLWSWWWSWGSSGCRLGTWRLLLLLLLLLLRQLLLRRRRRWQRLTVHIVVLR